MELQRKLGDRCGLALTLAAIGGIEVALGNMDGATAHLDEALTIGREENDPEAILSATVEFSRLPGGDAGAIVAVLEEVGERISAEQHMAARFRLWQATADKTHLDEAHRRMVEIRDNVPEEYRESLTRNIPMIRDIEQAWGNAGD